MSWQALYYFAAQVVGIDSKSKPPLTIPGADSFTVDKVLGLVYEVAGFAAVIAIVIGGILYVTSDGDPSKLTRAKNTIIYSVIGLIMVIMAAAITAFVAGAFA